jgi:aminopeptidase N
MAIANTAQDNRTAVEGTNYVTTKFKRVPSVQSYLIAFTVSDFLFVQDTTGFVPQRIFAKPQSIANGEARYALENSYKILLGFEQYLSIPYSLEKMDQAAMPDFAAGAMVG